MDLFEIIILIGWFGLPALAILQIRRTREKSSTERTCPNCDRELTGARVGRPCPECGTIPTISWQGPSDPDRILCRACGHDLEGLAWNADCPECGLHSAALPRFESRHPSYPIKALLGVVLLAGWLGLTAVMVFLGGFSQNAPYNWRQRARAAPPGMLQPAPSATVAGDDEKTSPEPAPGPMPD